MATSTPTGQQQYVDFDEYIDFQLQKTRSHIKWTDVLTAAAGVVTFLLAYVLLFTLVDQWLIPGGFGPNARLLMFGAVMAACAGWATWRVIIPYLKRVTRLYAAREIEKAHPELKSTLLNLVDLERSNHPVPEQVRAALEKRAAVSLSRMDLEQVVDRKNLMRTSYALLAVVILVCLYTLFSPKKLSFSRPLLPAADVNVPTQTKIAGVNPGDADVLARSQLEVVADVTGKTPEQVTLLYTTADRKFVDEPVEMRETEDGRKQYRTILNGESGRGILQEMTYRIVAGDAQTRDFRVGVIQPPSATVQQLFIEYPSYMQLTAETRAGGNIDTWEGAEITLSATTNMPVTGAVVLFSDTEDMAARAEEMPVRIDGSTNLTAKWTLAFRSDGTFPRFYRIACKNAKGESDPEPTLYSINIRPDQAPDLALVDPVTDLERPANAVVPMLVQARDPDFQLRSLQLHIEKNGEEIAAPYLFEGRQQAVSTRYEWNLLPLGLTAGEMVTYWIEARDNRQPLGNRKNTPRLNVQIVDSARQEDVQQQLADDRRRQDEMLRQKQGGGNDEDQQQLAQNEPPDQPGDNGESQEGAQGSETGQQATEPQPSANANDGKHAGAQQDSKPTPRGQKQDPSKDNLSPEGGDDAEVLKKLIERQQAQQDQNQKGVEESSSHQPDKSDNSQNADANSQSDPQSRQDSQPRKDQPENGSATKDDRKDTPLDDAASPRPGQDTPPDPHDPQSDPAAAEQNQTGRNDEKNADRPGSQPQNAAKQQSPPGEKHEPADPPQPANNPPRAAEQDQQTGHQEAQPGKGDAQQPAAQQNKPERPQPGESGGDQQGNNQPQPGQNEGQSTPLDPGRQMQDPGQRSPNNGESAEKNDDPNKPQQTDNPPQGGEPQPTNERPEGQATEKKSGERNPNSNPSETRDAPPDPQRKPPQDGVKRNDQDSDKPGQNTGKASDAEPSSQQSAGEQSPQKQDGNPSSKKQTREGRPSRERPQSSRNLPEGLGPEDLKNTDKNPPPGERPRDSESADPPQNSADSSPPGDDASQGGDSPRETGTPADGNSTKSPSDSQGTQDPAGQKSAPGAGGERSGKPSGNDAANPGRGSAKGGDKPSEQSDPADSASRPSEQAGGNNGGGSRPAGQTGARRGAERGPGDRAAEAQSPDNADQKEDPNLEFNKRATNLVLEKLGKDLERGEVDEQLLKELGWTEDELKKFVDRIGRQMNDTHQSPESEARRRQFEWMLKTLDVASPESRREGSTARDRSSEGIESRRIPVPAEYRESWEAYTRDLARRANAAQKNPRKSP